MIMGMYIPINWYLFESYARNSHSNLSIMTKLVYYNNLITGLGGDFEEYKQEPSARYGISVSGDVQDFDRSPRRCFAA